MARLAGHACAPELIWRHRGGVGVVGCRVERRRPPSLCQTPPARLSRSRSPIRDLPRTAGAGIEAELPPLYHCNEVLPAVQLGFKAPAPAGGGVGGGHTLSTEFSSGFISFLDSCSSICTRHTMPEQHFQFWAEPY